MHTDREIETTMPETSYANEVLTILCSGVVAAVVSVIVSHQLSRSYTELSIKRDVLRRFAGNRSALTGAAPDRSGELFAALNEIFVVYADHPDVIRALTTLHAERDQSARLDDNVTTLVKSMAKAARVSVSGLNDSFILIPFTAGPNVFSGRAP